VKSKKALITGVTGQDGSYLAEPLLSKGYEVHGLVRRSSTFNTRRINHLYIDPHEPGARFFLHYGDLTDSGQLSHLIYNIHRGYLYTLDTGEPSTPAPKAWLAERCHRLHLSPHGISHSLAGLDRCLLRGLPLQVGWFYNPRQVRAVRAALAEDELDIVYCCYIRSAEAVRARNSGHHPRRPRGQSRPVSFWAMQLSQSLNTRRRMKNFRRLRDLAIFALESRLLRRYEAHIWADFHRTVLIGPRDLEEVKRVCREYRRPEIDNFFLNPHGVDRHRFAPRGQDLRGGAAQWGRGLKAVGGPGVAAVSGAGRPLFYRGPLDLGGAFP
jgi:hypothetical protein